MVPTRVLVALGSMLLLVASGLLLADRAIRLAHPLVAVIPETTAQEIWEGEHAGVAAAALGTEWRIYWNGPSSEDQVAKQIALVRHASEMHAAGLILAPDHPLALTTAVRSAVDSGVPTVIVSTGLSLQPRPNLAFVLNDDEAAGREAADYAAKLLAEHGQVALLGDDSDSASASARARSFATALAARHPAIELVARPRGSFRLGEAEQETEDLLRRYPALRAIISIGITETRGAAIALAGLAAPRRVALVGFDQDLDLMFAVRRGAIQAMVVQNTFAMGQQAMTMIEAARHGGSMPAMTRVAPLLVTRNNIDEPAVQQVLSMDWRPQKP